MSLLDMPVETLDSEAILARFNKLVSDLLRGTMNRNTFQPWEIEILLDIEACNIREAVKRETLRRYQKAVQRAKSLDQLAESMGEPGRNPIRQT